MYTNNTVNPNGKVLSRIIQTSVIVFTMATLLALLTATNAQAASSRVALETYDVSQPKSIQGSPTSNAGTTYYIDCQTGNDARNGRSPSSAWRSLEKANQAPLQPGNSLLFKRGCTWRGSLQANWQGTASRPILIGAYGNGNKPAIHNRPQDVRNRFHVNVRITGSHQIIENIRTYIYKPPKEAGCQNHPVGFYVGFNIGDPDKPSKVVSNNVLRHVEATKHTVGVHLNRSARNNRVEHSAFRGNHVMHKLTPKGTNAYDDIGAWGILLRGDNNEIAHNYFAHNNGWCAYDTPPQGNSIEIYEGRNNNIHHNTAYHDLHFSELGGSPQKRASGNRFAYNLVISPLSDARFVIVRGGGNRYGPTYSTQLYHNTVYFTGRRSQGVVCHAGCSNQILHAAGNILWAQEKAIFADRKFKEHNNIYWKWGGDPFVQFMGFEMNSSSMITDPRFINPNTQQFQLRVNSPAIDAAAATVHESIDIVGRSVPTNGRPDVGAFEWNNSASSSSNIIPLEDLELAQTIEDGTENESDGTSNEETAATMPEFVFDDDSETRRIHLPLVSN